MPYVSVLNDDITLKLIILQIIPIISLMNTTTVLWPFFRDHPGEPVPEENFWTLWCKGRLTEADTPTIRLGATPSGLTSAHLHHPPLVTYYSLMNTIFISTASLKSTWVSRLFLFHHKSLGFNVLTLGLDWIFYSYSIRYKQWTE